MEGREKNMLHGNHSSRVKNITYLCDRFPGALVVYSLRRLRKDYVGPLIRVSDNVTETDIYSKHDTITGMDYVDWVTIRQFYPSGVVRVRTWYDQSGNGYNLTTSSFTLSPTIQFVGGSGLGDNRAPFYNLNGFILIGFPSARRMFNSSFNQSTPITFFTIASNGGNRKSGVIFDSYNNSQCVLYSTGVLETPNYRWSIANGTVLRDSRDQVALQLKLLSGVIGSVSNLSVDYGFGNIATLSTNNLNGLSVGDIRGNPNPVVTGYDLEGSIAELIIYPKNIHDRVEIIRAQLLDDYNLYAVLNYRQ